MDRKVKIEIVVALDEAGGIGKGNALPWHLPEDLKLFKRITTGGTMLMGRKTFESIGRPLPNRRNLVLTRDEAFGTVGVEVVHSLKEAMGLLPDEERLFCIGGGELFKQMLPLADTIWLTRVHAHVESEVFFPEIIPEAFDWTFQLHQPVDERHGHSFTHYQLTRKVQTE